MNNLFKRLKYYFLSKREKNLEKKLHKTTKRSFSNKTTKTIFGTAGEVTLNTETLRLIDKVKENVKVIVDKVNCNPEELLNYIKISKTPIYRLDNADKLLSLIKEEEGFITEQEGLNALYLGIITGQGLKFKTPAMFVLRNGEIDKYYMLHQFYRWYSMKLNLPGFEYEVQKKFKEYLYDKTEEVIKRFTMEDILSIKEAISRDQEATSFVLNYTKEIEGSKKVLDKIKNNNGADI